MRMIKCIKCTRKMLDVTNSVWVNPDDIAWIEESHRGDTGEVETFIFLRSDPNMVFTSGMSGQEIADMVQHG